MSQEIELKLRFARRDLPQLYAHPRLPRSAARTQLLRNTYYDNAELALHQRRIAVRLRQKNGSTLLTVKSSAPASGGLSIRQEWEEAATPGVFDFSLVSDPQLRQFLDRIRPTLRPIFSTDFERQTWIVNEGDARIEVAIDLGHIRTGTPGNKRGAKNEEKICEIELELLSGSMEHLFTLCHTLQRRLALIPALPSKAERGYQCYLATPAAPAFAPPPQLSTTDPPGHALRQLLLAQVEHLQRNESGLLQHKDPEYLHQSRLALRRLRSALAFFSPLLPADYNTQFAPRWRKLSRLLGHTRDWDVFLHDTLPPMLRALPHHPELRALRKLAQQEAAAGRKEIRQHCNSAAYGRLLLDFTAATHALSLPETTDLCHFSWQRWQEWRHESQTLAAQTPANAPRALHHLRRRLKALQFSRDLLATPIAEPVTPAASAPAKPADRALVKTLLQELGQYNDLVVARQLLRTRKHDSPLAHAWIAGQRALLEQQLPNLLKYWSHTP